MATFSAKDKMARIYGQKIQMRDFGTVSPRDTLYLSDLFKNLNEGHECIFASIFKELSRMPRLNNFELLPMIASSKRPQKITHPYNFFL